jgi:hypothetical protein
VLVDGEIVALDEEGRGQLISSTAALLWQLLDGTASVDDLAADVADVFELDIAAARRDVEDFALEMVARGLVVPPGPVSGDGPGAH